LPTVECNGVATATEIEIDTLANRLREDAAALPRMVLQHALIGHQSKEIVVSTLQRISINAVTALVLGTIRVSAGELPTYEVAGFPISSVQIAVLRSDRVQEQSPAPTLILNGMPASPVQTVVLHRQTKLLTADKFNKDRTSD
jgi:hypothetical protein